jgi:hypothetical protein
MPEIISEIISIKVIKDFPTTFYFELDTYYTPTNDPETFRRLEEIFLSTAGDLANECFIVKHKKVSEVEKKLRETVKAVDGEEQIDTFINLKITQDFLRKYSGEKFEKYESFYNAKSIIKSLMIINKYLKEDMDWFLCILDESGVKAWQMVSVSVRLLPCFNQETEKLYDELTGAVGLEV